MDARWKHPWTSIVCGPTGCGKTIFVKTFLRHLSDMSDVRFERILFYYAEWQDAYQCLQCDTSKNKEEVTNDIHRNGYGNTLLKSKKNIIEFREGLPRPEDYSSDPLSPKLVIIDDLMRESSSCDTIVDLFTKGSHHKNLSVILISQNLFHQGRGQRDISLNANYIVVFKNPRDRAQIRHLARQVYPDDPKFLEEAYYDATSRPHGYLLLDLKQSTPDEYRFRTCIFPDDTTHYVYIPRRSINRALTEEV
jgi:Cdc6-like AAA superfamily ATPase